MRSEEWAQWEVLAMTCCFHFNISTLTFASPCILSAFLCLITFAAAVPSAWNTFPQCFVCLIPPASPDQEPIQSSPVSITHCLISSWHLSVSDIFFEKMADVEGSLDSMHTY